jgi:hypothetical protein
MDTQIESLQHKETELWARITALLRNEEKEKEIKECINELIEINLELEASCTM